MAKNRTDRLNSLLREVISDVIRKEVKDPDVHELFTVTRVDITKDLRHAKVYVSVIADDKERKLTIQALQTASGFIASRASKQVVLRFFPELFFKLDTTVDSQMRIEELLKDIHEEMEDREQHGT